MSSQKRSKTGYPKRKANSIDEIQIKEIIMSSHGKPHLVDSSSHRYAHFNQSFLFQKLESPFSPLGARC